MSSFRMKNNESELPENFNDDFISVFEYCKLVAIERESMNKAIASGNVKPFTFNDSKHKL